MKKLLVALLVVATLAMACFAQDITVTLNGQAIDFADQAPEIVEGRTLVPLRAIFEALGASVEWDQATKTVTSSMDDVTIKLTIGDNTLYRNDEGVTLDVAAQILNGRTMVPARAIAEAYGVDVQWDAATRTVVLTKEAKAEEAPADGIVKYSEAYATGNDGLQIVADPTNPDNEVYFMESNAGTNTSWNYFWMPATFKPGERYLVSFDVYLDTDALGGAIEEENPTVGICFSYGDFAENEEGKVTHHGGTIDKKSSSVYPGVQTWTHATYIYEMPETLNENSKMDFGIYGNPVAVSGEPNKLAVNYYLDNVTVELYEGSAENGVHSVESFELAEKVSSFDINTAKGLVFDLNEDEELFSFSGCSFEYAGGALVMTAEGDQIDPIANFKDVSALSADKYCAVAVRFKAEGVTPGEDYVAVYFATEKEENLSQSKCVPVYYSKLGVDSEGYYVAYLNMLSNEFWNGNLKALRVDPGNSNGVYTIDKIVLVEA